jgi:hypothetical protein
MSSQNSIQRPIDGCPFCRSKRLPWTNHKISNCKNLKKHKCEHCHFIGHSVSHCQQKIEENHKRWEENQRLKEEAKRQRWEENQRLKEEAKVRNEEAKVRNEEKKAKMWSTIASKNIPEQDRKKMEAENLLLKAKAEAEKRRKAEEDKALKLAAKKRWETNYPYRMAKKYGIKEHFYYDAFDSKTIMAYKGDFWEFRVEGTKDDHEIAKKWRESHESASKFIEYLKEKYWINWLYVAEGTIDDCKYLCDLRDEKEAEAYEEEIRMKKRQREREEEETKFKKEMEDKLKSGRITKKEYNVWVEEEEEYLESAFESDGLRWYDNFDRNQRLDAGWKIREANRKEALEFPEMAEEERKKKMESDEKEERERIKLERQYARMRMEEEKKRYCYSRW